MLLLLVAVPVADVVVGHVAAVPAVVGDFYPTVTIHTLCMTHMGQGMWDDR